MLAALEREPDPPTTVKGMDDAVHGHVADSLSGLEVAELRASRRIADLGSGAGFPGLALAVAIPDARVDLLEASARKCAVIDRLAAAAGLENARAVPVRAEQWAAEDGRDAYDAVTARAVAGLPVLLEYAAPLLRAGGVLVAWKGARRPDEEAAAGRAADLLGLEQRAVLPVRPFPEARNRHLHVWVQTRPTPPIYPRRPGMAAKRPLG